MLTVHESWSKACAKASTKFSARNRQDLWFERAAHHAGLTNYGDEGFSLFLRKVCRTLQELSGRAESGLPFIQAFIKGAGYSDEALDRKIIGVVNTGVSYAVANSPLFLMIQTHCISSPVQSDYIPCHGNMPQLLDAVCRGILLEGALPFKFPTISLHEAFSNPTSMYLRNLMSMDTEEMIKAQPMDAVILIGGCDKTVPAQLMGAISADIPALQLVVGPMVTGSHKDVRVGACTDCRGYWGKHRAGLIDIEEIAQVGVELVPSVGVGCLLHLQFVPIKLHYILYPLDMWRHGDSIYNGLYRRSLGSNPTWRCHATCEFISTSSGRRVNRETSSP